MRSLLPRTRWFLKYLITIPLVLIIIFNIQLISQIREFNGFTASLKRNKQVSNDEQWLANQSVPPPPIVNDATTTTTTNDEEIEKLKILIDRRNSQAFIRNRHFIQNLLKQEVIKTTTNSRPPKTTTNTNTATTTIYPTPEFLVILVQIHSRISYLKELIASLNETRHIEHALVIFSHDIYDPEMNRLVEAIDFCATLQIFYPYSMQLSRNRFPGKDVNDCPKNVKKSQ
jgi:hypothetical protein